MFCKYFKCNPFITHIDCRLFTNTSKYISHKNTDKHWKWLIGSHRNLEHIIIVLLNTNRNPSRIQHWTQKCKNKGYYWKSPLIANAKHVCAAVCASWTTCRVTLLSAVSVALYSLVLTHNAMVVLSDKFWCMWPSKSTSNSTLYFMPLLAKSYFF